MTREERRSDSTRRLGDCELEAPIARHGMGVVYRARHLPTGRTVAVKALPCFDGIDGALVSRFHREVAVARRLRHPGIVESLGSGEQNGVLYYVMEFVDGPTMASLLDRLRGRVPKRLQRSLVEEAGVEDRFPALREPPGRPDVANAYVRSCVAVAVDVADALAVAHAEGIVHRDLKPSNVMIREPGKVVVVDFGLARDRRVGALTLRGQRVGTPGYMAPEQAAGALDVDVRLDVYGLGGLLFELLALQPAFCAPRDDLPVQPVRERTPPRLRRLNRRVPTRLEAIVDACLAREPSRRYPGVEALGLDLRLFLATADS